MSDLTEAEGEIVSVKMKGEYPESVEFVYDSGDIVTLTVCPGCCDRPGFSQLCGHSLSNLVGRKVVSVQNDNPTLSEDRILEVKKSLSEIFDKNCDCLRTHLLTLKLDNDDLFLLPYWDISNGYYDCYLMSDITKGLDSDSDSEDEDEKDNEENNNNDE
jgi:hypothetical protein